jgi:hypothetical protein
MISYISVCTLSITFYKFITAKAKKKKPIGLLSVVRGCQKPKFHKTAIFLMYQCYATNVAYFFQDLFPQTASEH